MAKLFARQTALTNISGRISYISSPKKQEKLLASLDTAADLMNGRYWRQLAAECKQASKFVGGGRGFLEGRELMLLLSNSLLDRMSPEEITRTIAESFQERYGRPCVVALHFNKTEKSLHAHVVFGERDLLSEPEIKVAERNLFFDAEGKRRYKKSDVLDADKNLLPGCRIVKKGEVYERRFFGNIREEIGTREWLADAKHNWVLKLRNGVLKGDVEIREYDPVTGELPQQYIGNKVDAETAARIEKNNEAVKAFNSLVLNGDIPIELARTVQQQHKKAKRKTEKLIGVLKMIKDWLEKMRVKEVTPAEPAQKQKLDEMISSAGQRSGTFGPEKETDIDR